MTYEFKPLTPEQREKARENALKIMAKRIGPEPKRENYSKTVYHRFPPSVTRIITFLCIVLLLAAFTPSAIRLYHIGSETFGQGISDSNSKEAAGIAIVLMAEIGQTIFLLALSTLTASRSAKIMLYGGATISTLIALVGNIQVAWPADLFALLESISPPLLVLGTAYVLKGQILNAIEQRHSSNVAYQSAITEWRLAMEDLTNADDWTQHYANALRNAIAKAQGRSAKATEAIANATNANWKALVAKEMQVENWFANTDSNDLQLPKQSENMQKQYLATCDECNWTGSYSNEKSATLAKNAHKRFHMKDSNNEDHFIN